MLMKRFLRFLLFALISLVILGCLVTFMLPSKGQVERDGVIDAPPAVVFAELSELKNHPAWNAWAQGQAGQEIIFSDRTTGPGAYYTWKKKASSAADGSFDIVRSEPDSLLSYRLSIRGMPSFDGLFHLSPSADGKSTGIHWHMTFKAGWKPWWRFYATMVDRLVGPQLETNLTQLKKVCETKNPS